MTHPDELTAVADRDAHLLPPVPPHPAAGDLLACVVQVDGAGTAILTELCAPLAHLLGRPERQLVGQPVMDLVHPEHRVQVAGALERAGQGTDARSSVLLRAVRPDGSVLWLRVLLAAHLPAREGGRRFALRVLDETGRQLAAARRELPEAVFREVFEQSPTPVALIGLTPARLGQILIANRALGELLGYGPGELTGQDMSVFAQPDETGSRHTRLAQAIREGTDRWELERPLLARTGRTVWVRQSVRVVRAADGSPRYSITRFEDVTARRQAEAELGGRSMQDPLTGLANRAGLVDQLDVALSTSRVVDQRVGLLVLDLDDFGDVNDTLGRRAADELIRAMAGRVAGCLREGDLAGRLAGDVFAVLCRGLGGPQELQRVAERVARAVSSPVRIAEQELTCTASIGQALAGPQVEPEWLLAQANTAMLRAKRLGKARIETVDAADQARARRRLSVDADLRRGMRHHELVLAYQPSVDLTSGQVVAFEALLRWQHPVHGLLGPGAFLDVAEERELIVPLGAWVLDQACAQGAAWHLRWPRRPPEVWVNISSRQLARPGFARTVRELLARHGCPPHVLVLELTERQVLTASAEGAADLGDLVALGVGLAVDDFGTGHNGLDYLRTLPVTSLKIDRSYVSALDSDRTVEAITASVVGLGRSLDLTVVAEGVETADQCRRVAELGCHQGQGYLFGRPGTAARADLTLLEQVPAESS